jgi:hypothetical protein
VAIDACIAERQNGGIRAVLVSHKVGWLWSVTTTTVGSDRAEVRSVA